MELLSLLSLKIRLIRHSPPSFKPVPSIQLDDTDGKQCTEGIPELRSRVVYGSPEGYLLATVEHTEIIKRPWEECDLNKS